MDTILQLIQQRKALVALIGGIIGGLLLGLAIGWWWWPVEWTNSTPANLRSDFQGEYLTWVAEQYMETGDLEKARNRLGVTLWKEGQIAQTLDALEKSLDGQEALAVRKLAQDLEATPPPTEAPTAEEEGGLRPVAQVCGIGLLILALVGGAYFLFTRLRQSKVLSKEDGEGISLEGFASVIDEPKEPADWKGKPPQAQFVTSYTAGDDHYDPSFSIEMEDGEFMGECGVGISESIGVGEPSKVTALEVWLFDKNDIRTVTKVLMSDYAFHDEALKAKLAPKGEPVLVQPGEDVMLNTRRMRMRARIVEAEYGSGDLPANSFFKKVTVELAAWVKPESEAEPAASPELAPEASV
jgi:hypothetical protein